MLDNGWSQFKSKSRSLIPIVHSTREDKKKNNAFAALPLIFLRCKNQGSRKTPSQDALLRGDPYRS
jgi:hypothetical protein